MTEGVDRFLVGRVERRRHRPARLTGTDGQIKGRERVSVDRLERPRGRRTEVARRSHPVHPVRPGKGQRDRQLHVRRAGLGDRRPVHESHHRMNDRLRVHDDVDPVVRDPEQQVGLDDLESFVDQGGRVDGDHRAHRPGRVSQGLRGGDLTHLRRCSTTERTAGRRDDQLAHLRPGAAAQALGQRAVFRVDRHDLARRGSLRHQRTTGNQGFLVGQRQQPAGAQGGKRRLEADRPGDPVEHDVRFDRLDEFGGGPRTRDLRPGTTVGPGPDGDRGVGIRERLLRQKFGAASPGGESDDVEHLRVRGDHIECLGADRAGGTENDDPATARRAGTLKHGICRWMVGPTSRHPVIFLPRRCVPCRSPSHSSSLAVAPLVPRGGVPIARDTC